MSTPVLPPQPIGFDGTLLRPGDDGYDEARSLFNGMIDRRPAVIARCADARDVAGAIAMARQQGLEISVRSGGHGVSGSALADGALTIDCASMKKIEVDVGGRRAIVGAGVTWGELDGAIHDFVTLANDVPSPLTAMLLQPYGGAFARVGDDATALGHRSTTKWCWHNLSEWMDPSQDQANIEFSRLVATAMAPHSMEAVHPNYVSDTGAARVKSLYEPAVYDRLVALKRIWDPENIFHLNQNITP